MSAVESCDLQVCLMEAAEEPVEGEVMSTLRRYKEEGSKQYFSCYKLKNSEGPVSLKLLSIMCFKNYCTF